MQGWQGSMTGLKTPALNHWKTQLYYEQSILQWHSCVYSPEEGVVRQKTMSLLSRMCQLWNMSWYILHYVWRLETLPPRIIWWEKHITRACVFLGFSYLLRVKPQRAAHNSSETCIKVNWYSQQICTRHKARASGGHLKKKTENLVN